ncbi:hypothetical protein JCM10207_003587 [Rhodosporidiobolus poonsookiae]
MAPNGQHKTDPNSVHLPLNAATAHPRLGLFSFLHLVWVAGWQLLFFIPLRLFFVHVLFRLFHPVTRTLGRPILADYAIKSTQSILARFDIAQIRVFFNRAAGFSPTLAKHRDWQSKVQVNGITGEWIANPKTRRSEDDAVTYLIHGGGFVTDTGALAQEFLARTVETAKEKHGLDVSVFQPLYHLAPEYKYPTQLIEILAGYHYLVNTLGIKEDKIIVAGDSAGGNLAAVFLLHLARPAKEIHVPSELGPTPGQPGGAFLISPMVNVASTARAHSANQNLDLNSTGYCFRAAWDYVGLGTKMPWTHRFRKRWVLNPLWHIFDPQRVAAVPADKLADTPWWKEVKGVEIFKSPYVSPALVDDSKWLAAAFPGEGKTLVAWGGVEVFADDIELFYRQLEKAGVEPVKQVKPYGVHIWPFFDYAVPTAWKTKSKGPDRSLEYGLNGFLRLIKDVAGAEPKKDDGAEQEKATTTARAPLNQDTAPAPVPAPKPVKPTPVELPTKGESFAAAAASTDDVAKDAPIIARGEGKILEAHLEDGKLLADKKLPKKPEPTLPPIPDPALQKFKPAPAPTQDTASTVTSAREQGKLKKKKPQAPTGVTPDSGKSYASLAASSVAVQDDAPVVAKGEGDVLKPTLDDGQVHAELAQGKAEAAGKNGGGAAGGSWAKVAGHEADSDAPVVAEGEGDVLKPRLEDGSIVAEKA